MKNARTEIKALFLEITTRCNIKCIKCPNRYFLSKEKDIDEQTLRFILFDILRNFQGKILIATGEPTLRRDYIELISNWAEGNNKREVVIFTNGTLLQTLSEKVLKNKQLSFVVSLDGITEKTVKTFQIGANVKSICSNIVDLRNKDFLKKLVLNFTLHKLLIKELDEIFYFAKKLRIRKIYFTPLLNFNFPNREIIKNLQFNKEEFPIIKDLIKRKGRKLGFEIIIASNNKCKTPKPIFHTNGYVSYCEGTDGIYSFKLNKNILKELTEFNLPEDICRNCIKKEKNFFRKLPKRLIQKQPITFSVIKQQLQE